MLRGGVAGSLLDSWWVLTGVVAAALAIMESLRRMVVGLWKGVRSLVRFSDALPKLLALADKADRFATKSDVDSVEQKLDRLIAELRKEGIFLDGRGKP